MPVKNVTAIDHLQSVAKHKFNSPIMFGSSLLIDVLNCMRQNGGRYLWPTSSGGKYNVLKSWLSGSSIEILAMPEGDILTAIGHDKVFVKEVNCAQT